MTSAQNHRPLLSGNNHFFLAILLMALVLQGCELFRQTPQRPDVVRDEEEEDVVEVDTVNVNVDTIGGLDQVIRKEQYSMAIMLPFYLDSRFMANYDLEGRTSAYRPLMSLEMYEGMLLALDDLEKEGLKLTVNVFDTENNPGVVANHLLRPEVKSADLIIGPLFSKNLSIAADFALQEEVFVISPLTPRVEIDQPNPYFVSATPSSESLIRGIAKYAAENFPKGKLIAVYKKGEEEELLQLLEREYLNRTRHTGEVSNFRAVEVSELPEFDGSDFSFIDTNIIVSLSFGTSVTSKVASKVNRLPTTRPVIMMGMPGVLEKMDALGNDNIFTSLMRAGYRYPTTFFVNKESRQFEEFAERYRARYKMDPTEFSARGYNLMMYIGLLLKNYGLGFTYHLEEAERTALDTNFEFVPVLIDPDTRVKKSNVRYYQNQYVPIIKFENYRLRQVN